MDSPARAAQALLDRERSLLARLGGLLEASHAPEATRRRLADLAQTLDELFLLVVAGEFNAGKSTVVNALFGRRVMEEGPVPTTDKITVLRHGTAEASHRRGEFVTERRIDHPLLESLAVVDTPGTNSIVREHQALTEDFVPRADLVLFVTSYDRPLSESERTFLEYIRGAWGKRLVVAVNKADLAKRLNKSKAFVSRLLADGHNMTIKTFADVLFHLLVMLQSREVALGEVMAELARRQGASGLAEKASRPGD